MIVGIRHGNLMHWSRYSLLLIILLLAGCRQSDSSQPPTPTPFTSVGITYRAPVGEPIPISLANLAANPELFEGTTLQLRGQYQALPILICQSDSHPSPATWGLVAEGLQANATGLDQQLRQLIREGQEITVEGRWLHYAGPVGCGKTAPVQEIWYLSVSRIIDPHPMAKATSALVGVPTEPAAIVEVPPTQTLITTEEPADTVETATLEPTTVAASPTYVSSPLPPAGTATALPGETPSLVPTPVTATPVGTGTAVTATATITGSATPDGRTATPARGTATPGPTATPSDGATIPKGETGFEDLSIGTLASGAIDDWTVTVSSSDFITITVAPASSANMIFSVLNDSGQIIVDQQDQAPAGKVETITNLSLPEASTYHIHIATDPAEQTDYALMVMNSESYSFTFRGTLTSGAQRSDSLAADSDHFWFFHAADGETISLQVTPNGEADAYVELYGPDGSRLLTLDNGGSGEAEILENHSILATGMYSIRVGEFDFTEMSYQIVVSKS